MTFKWITLDAALAAHQRSLLDHGGAEGVRDNGMLERAPARPQIVAADGEPTLFERAAALGCGLAKEQPFVDGNKRAAFLCVYVFLGINGHELDADEAEAAAITLDLAAGVASEAEFALWLKANCRPL